jgi:septal ring factor EnvC (AmiA/AmiB activator)
VRPALLLAGILLASPIPRSIPAQQTGQTGEDRLRAQRDELERIKRERADLQRKLSTVQRSVHNLSDEVTLLDKEHEATARVVKALDQQLISITDEVRITSASLQEAEQEATQKRALLHRGLIDIYKRGPLFSAEVLFSAHSVADLVARYKYLHILAVRDKSLVHRMEDLQTTIAARREQLVHLESGVEQNRTEKAEEAARLTALETARSRSLVQAQEDAKKTKARLDELARSEARLNNVIASLENTRRTTTRGSATATASSIRTSDLGKLDWPVEGTFLYRFGRFVNPNNTTTRWNGIGIGAPAGTPVKSVSSGTVAYAGTMGTYGNTVILEHGGGDYSVYGSLGQVEVRKGARISKGQTLGTVGISDPALGPHLHFEIRRGGPAVDPTEWLRAAR